MDYDLIIKNGTIVDGSGLARYRADVGIKDGVIIRIDRIDASANEVIDASGLVVAPGFVDGHTHMDAQIFWDPIGSCSCYHGVTTVVMGNCGFTLAPCRESEADFVFRNLERAEDISRDAMLAGIKWRWETFPEYMEVLETLPKGINYSSYLGHSALRTYVMGERAFVDEATDDELAMMCEAVKEALRAGAVGFSTTRSMNHETSDGRPVSSRLASWREIEAIVRAMGEVGSGILQIAGEPTGASGTALKYYTDLKALSVETGRPVTFGMQSTREAPGAWRRCFEVFDEAAAQGGRMFVQVHTRAINVLLSFATHTPFDQLELWRDVRALPPEAQKAALRDPSTKARLIEVARRPFSGPKPIGAETRPPQWDSVYILDTIQGPHRTMAEVAQERGVDPIELMIDLALESDFRLFLLQPIANEDPDQALELMKHPRSVVTFSDAGAHVTQIMDNSLQTHLLSHWVRQKRSFTLEEAIRMITYDTATHWGFHDRGLIREGMAADIVVFDPETVAPRLPELVSDLPSGAKRLKQLADGIHVTIVGGQVLLRDNVHTGALPGKLLRARVSA